MVTKYYKN